MRYYSLFVIYYVKNESKPVEQITLYFQRLINVESFALILYIAFGNNQKTCVNLSKFSLVFPAGACVYSLISPHYTASIR